MAGIKNLIFDMGGVLIDLDRPTFRKAFERLGIASIHDNVSDDYRQKELYMEFESGNISTAAFRASMRRLSDQELTDQQINEAWVSVLMDIPEYKLEWLLKLRGEFNVMLLSNTNSIHWQWAKDHYFSYKGHSAEDFFDRIYLSFHLHKQKPDVEIFKHVLEDSMIEAESTFFIDDSAVNCKAAESLGIHTYCCPTGTDWSFLFQPGGEVYSMNEAVQTVNV